MCLVNHPELQDDRCLSMDIITLSRGSHCLDCICHYLVLGPILNEFSFTSS